MKISVAMATYNGEKYIKEQLESILHQTFPVDEIIISDDGSLDSTISIVKTFEDSRIKVLTDNINHGYCGNFEHALKATTGDIIYLSDQDDIWLLDKVEKTLGIFMNDPDIELIITDGVIIDKNGCYPNSKEMRVNDSINSHFSKYSAGILLRNRFFIDSIHHCLAHGMLMCFNRRFLDSILPFPACKSGHDDWICFCAMNRNSAYYLNEPLVKYRIHDTNASISSKNVSIKKKFERVINRAYNQPYDLYNKLCSMLKKISESNELEINAIQTAERLKHENEKQIEALSANRFRGSITLIKLFLTNAYYKQWGRNYFLGQLTIVILGKNFRKKYKLDRVAEDKQ